MRWVQRRTIEGDPHTVFDLLADWERWPRLLPHVRAARLEKPGRAGGAVVRVVYERFGLPVACTCRVGADLGALRLTLLHLRGHAAGMREVWTVTPADGGSSLEYACTAPGQGWRGRIVATALLLPLAGRTIEMVDLLAEADRLARVRDLEAPNAPAR